MNISLANIIIINQSIFNKFVASLYRKAYHENRAIKLFDSKIAEFKKKNTINAFTSASPGHDRYTPPDESEKEGEGDDDNGQFSHFFLIV